MDFWTEYFGLRRGDLPTCPADAILQLSCLMMCERKWNPQYEYTQMLRRFSPVWKESKRYTRINRMYWAMKENKVVQK